MARREAEGRMLAARAYLGESEFRLEDIAVLEIDSDEVLVRVKASGSLG